MNIDKPTIPALDNMNHDHGSVAKGGAIPPASVTGTALVAAAIGTTVQAYDADLTTWAGITPGANVGTALAVAVGSAGAVVVNGGALGTPSSGTLTSCTFPTLNQDTTGSAAKWTTARNLAGNSVDGSANVAFSNKFVVQGTADAGLSGAQFLGALTTGVLKNTTTTGVLSIAVANTDYIAPSAVVTKTADFTVATGETWCINNKTSACIVTLPAAASWPGRSLTFQNYQAFTLTSVASDVVPQGGGAAGTAILLGVVGNWATLVSDGTNWVIMQAAAYNNLLLE